MQSAQSIRQAGTSLALISPMASDLMQNSFQAGTPSCTVASNCTMRILGKTYDLLATFSLGRSLPGSLLQVVCQPTLCPHSMNWRLRVS